MGFAGGSAGRRDSCVWRVDGYLGACQLPPTRSRRLAVPSFVFTPGRDFRERTASGRLTIRWRISRSVLIAAQQKRERRLEESTWASSTRLIVLRRVLRLSCPIR